MIFSSRKAIIGVFLVGILGACANVPSADNSNIYDRTRSERLPAKLSFVSIPVRDGDKSWNLGAVLRMPYATGDAKIPAVIVVHGSGGVDSRGGHYVQELNKIGIATLEIDLWAARGVQNPSQRPRSVVETLPDAFASLDFLANNPKIDASKVGIMGFSWGGVVSMLSANVKYRDRFAKPGQSFAAHAPFYPVCWVYNVAPTYEFKDLTGAPVLIQGGLADLYDLPDTCEKMVNALPASDKANVRLIMHADATHAWERREPDGVGNDPYSHVGKGGEFPLKYNQKATQDSTNAVLEFFTNKLKN